MATMPEPTPNALGQPPAPTAPAPIAPGAGAVAGPNLMETNPQPQTPFVQDGHKFTLPKPNYSKPGEDLLFGPTDRPQDMMNKVRPRNFVAQPQGLEQYLEGFTEAARQPDAPQELITFMRILNFHMGRA